MSSSSEPADSAASRRTFLSMASSAVMAGGLAAGYGALAYVCGRFLYTGTERKLAWLFVTEAAAMKIGAALPFRTPTGQIVTITRRADTGTNDDFLALSATCPHLGCQVHWESQNNRFFCPCHNGAFDVTGMATAGPPADAKQVLPRYPLKIENGLVFIEAPVERLG